MIVFTLLGREMPTKKLSEVFDPHPCNSQLRDCQFNIRVIDLVVVRIALLPGDGENISDNDQKPSMS